MHKIAQEVRRSKRKLHKEIDLQYGCCNKKPVKVGNAYKADKEFHSFVKKAKTQYTLRIEVSNKVMVLGHGINPQNFSIEIL